MLIYFLVKIKSFISFSNKERNKQVNNIPYAIHLSSMIIIITLKPAYKINVCMKWKAITFLAVFFGEIQ